MGKLLTEEEKRINHRIASKRWRVNNRKRDIKLIKKKYEKQRKKKNYLSNLRRNYKKRYKKNPEMFKAKDKLKYAIKVGKIKIELVECFMCKATDNLIKHHPDYSKPFDFMVLCKSCHSEIHGITKYTKNSFENLRSFPYKTS